MYNLDCQQTMNNLATWFSNSRNDNIYFEEIAALTKPSVAKEKHDLITSS